jgi:hypothetical protein
MAGVSSEDRLQQYFDGELEGDEAEALRRALPEDAELRAKLEGLAHLRVLLVAAAEERGDEVDSDALWERVAARLGEEEQEAGEDEEDEPLEEASPARPRLEALPGGRAPSPATTKRPSNVVWIGVSAALAIAAAVLLYVVRSDDGAGAPMAGAPPPGSEVVEVDFGYSTGAVFSVEGQEGERYAVVWISDEKPSFDEEGQEAIQ